MTALARKDLWCMGTYDPARRVAMAQAIGASGLAFMLNNNGERDVRYSTAPQTREAFVASIRACHEAGLTATATVWLSGDVESQVKGWADEFDALPVRPDFVEMDLEGEFKARVRGDGAEFVGWLERYWRPLGVPILCTTLGYPTAKTIPPAVWCAKRGNGGGVRPQAYSVVTSKGHGRTAGELPGVLQRECIRRWAEHVPRSAIWLGIDAYGNEPGNVDPEKAMRATVDETLRAGVDGVVVWSEEGLRGDGAREQARRAVLASYPVRRPIINRAGLGRFVPGGPRVKTWLAAGVGVGVVAAKKLGGL